MNDYDAWKTGWYDMGSKHCCHCENKEEILDEASIAFEKIIESLYSPGFLDKNKLEEQLDLLCHLLKIKLRTSDLSIERKSSVNVIAFTEQRNKNGMYNYNKN